jgi:hypothetical protein
MERNKKSHENLRTCFVISDAVTSFEIENQLRFLIKPKIKYKLLTRENGHYKSNAGLLYNFLESLWNIDQIIIKTQKRICLIFFVN